MALDSEIIKEKFFNILRDESALFDAFNFNIWKKKLFPDENPNKSVVIRELVDIQAMKEFLIDVDESGFDLKQNIDGLLSDKLKKIGVLDEVISKLPTSLQLKLETAMYAVESEESDRLFMKYINRLNQYKRLNNRAKSPEIVDEYKRASQQLLIEINDILYKNFNEYLEIISFDVYLKEAQEQLKNIADNLSSLRQKGTLSKSDYNNIQRSVRECELNLRQKINRTTEFYQWTLYDEDPFVMNLINDEVKQFEMILEKINKEMNQMLMVENKFETPSFLPMSSIKFQSKLRAVDNLFLESRRPATCSRDPGILLNKQTYDVETDRTGTREQVAGRRNTKCQQTLANMGDQHLTVEDLALFRSRLNDELENNNSSHTTYEDLTNGVRVVVEQIGDRILVSIVPASSLIHTSIASPKETIKDLVERTLKESNILDATFDSVYVSACVDVDVQGRTYANAFVKCAGETNLSQWDPRDSSLLYTDDKMCDMLMATVTTAFEHGVREGYFSGKDAAYAKKMTLKNNQLKTIFHEEQFELAKEKGKLHIAFYKACLYFIKLIQKMFKKNDTATLLCEKNRVSESKDSFFKDVFSSDRNNFPGEKTESPSTERPKPR